MKAQNKGSKRRLVAIQRRIERALRKAGFDWGRNFRSKTAWREANPGRVPWFNVRIFTRTAGKVWWGDLDPAKDKAKLRAVARRLRTRLYVIREWDDGGLEKVLLTPQQVVERAIWNTSAHAAIKSLSATRSITVGGKFARLVGCSKRLSANASTKEAYEK